MGSYFVIIIDVESKLGSTHVQLGIAARNILVIAVAQQELGNAGSGDSPSVRQLGIAAIDRQQPCRKVNGFVIHLIPQNVSPELQTVIAADHGESVYEMKRIVAGVAGATKFSVSPTDPSVHQADVGNSPA